MSAVAEIQIPWTAEEVTAELCQRHLRDYVRAAWRVVEPQAFVGGWHIDCVCEHLEAVTRGQIRNLIINVPPRYTKSLTTCVMWPSWEWGPFGRPETRWMFTSYAASLSTRDSVKCRRVIQSPWYQRLWGNRYQLTGDQNAKERYDNNKGGYRLATSVGGTGTGEGGDRIVVDDPHSIEDVDSELKRMGVLDWWDQTMSTRANDPKTSGVVMIMQRSHYDDLAGHLKRQGGYEFLILPAEFEPETRCMSSIGFKDPRTQPNELLWPERFGPEELARLKVTLGTRGAAAQLQQRPAPLQGDIFNIRWWKYYLAPPEAFDFMYQTWDLAFKDTKGSARVAGQVWGMVKANYYLLDEVCEHLSFTKTLDAIRMMSARWPLATAKYVEDKANGPAAISSLKDEISGIIACNPDSDKVSRAHAVTPLIEAGNVYLPNPETHPWVKDFVEEFRQFPLAFYKDRVDACTQGFLETRNRRRLRDVPPIVSMERRSGWVRE
jgi:predicted phage terminase large subunit-like protein